MTYTICRNPCRLVLGGALSMALSIFPANAEEPAQAVNEHISPFSCEMLTRQQHKQSCDTFNSLAATFNEQCIAPPADWRGQCAQQKQIMAFNRIRLQIAADNPEASAYELSELWGAARQRMINEAIGQN